MKSYLTFALVLILMCASELSAQKFWLTTYSFPGGPKNSISLVNDSCLIVGLTEGVIRSCDDAHNWDTLLTGFRVSRVFSSASGRVFAATVGKIYYSDNLGATWDSVSLSTPHPITRIVQSPNGDLFALASAIDFNLGYVGSGVFYSADNGTNWTNRSNGLGTYLHCEQIVADKNGRLYLAVADEYRTGNGGLFTSDNSGQRWQHITVKIDGRGVISDVLKVGNTFGLSVSPDDSIYLSFDGIATNVGVSLNLHKSINDINSSTLWDVKDVGGFVNWYNDGLLNNIHFAKNGNWYSSRNGTLNTGGSYFSRDQGRTWIRHKHGLGLNVFNFFDAQYFVENDLGKIYMVQMQDERIYWADTSGQIALPEIDLETELSIYPNPVMAGRDFFIENIETGSSGANGVLNVTIIEPHGKKLYCGPIKNGECVQAPLRTGVYLVRVQAREGLLYGRLLVH